MEILEEEEQVSLFIENPKNNNKKANPLLSEENLKLRRKVRT